MKAIGVIASDSEESDRCLGSERYQSHRPDFVGRVPEQEITLCVAHLAATGPAALQEGFEGTE